MKEKGTIVQANIDHFMQEDDPGTLFENYLILIKFKDSFDIMDSYSRRDLARSSCDRLDPSTLCDSIILFNNRNIMIF